MDNSLLKTARQAAYEVYKNNPSLMTQDVIHESYLAMMEAMLTWDSEKGSALNTWVAFKVRCNLCEQIRNKAPSFNDISFNDIQDDLVQSSNSHKVNPNLQSTDSYTMNPEMLLIISETIGAFSDTSKEIIRAIFNEEIQPEADNKNAVTREIKNYLRNKGFPWWKIQSAFKELRQYANSLA